MPDLTEIIIIFSPGLHFLLFQRDNSNMRIRLLSLLQNLTQNGEWSSYNL